MRIGALRINLEVIDSASLKDKRMVIKSLKDRIRNRFNVSISEIDEQDKWQRSTIGIVSVANDSEFLDTMINKILDYISEEKSVYILNSERNIF